MYIELVLLILLIIFLWGKWMVFLLLSPLMIWHNRRAARKAEASDQLIEEIPADVKPRNSIMAIFRRYFTGFQRYINIKVGYIPSQTIRNFIYRHIMLVTLEKYAIVYYGAEIRGSYRLKIGRGSIIGDKATLDARRGGITIGENVQFGSEVKLWTGSHDMNDPYFRSMPNKRGAIKIGNRAWIGPSVTIIHSVEIGEGAVVAAGSVVTKNIPPYEVWGGIPAKKIGTRNSDLKYEFSSPASPFY